MPPEDRTQPAPRILLVTDDRPLRDVLRFAVAASGWRVELAENAQHGLSRLAATPPDALVIDAALPGGEAAGLCRRLRHAGNDVPILMVGALDVADRIAALEAGADDALPRPFDVGELRARLRALLRRAGAGGADGLAFGELRLDRERHGVWVGDAFVDLSRTELQLLELLLVNAGTVLGHATIYDRVWGYDFGPGANSLRVYVGYLRRKLAAAGARPLIPTVRGVGYVLREPAGAVAAVTPPAGRATG
jgi:two-component system, OmpR family, response regulator MprA